MEMLSITTIQILLLSQYITVLDVKVKSNTFYLYCFYKKIIQDEILQF